MRNPALDKLKVTLKKGDEPLIDENGQVLDANVLSFWQWVGSDLLDNLQRGALAEYIVAVAIDCDDKPREEWAEVDLIMQTGDGEIKVEVKARGYVQSWYQKAFAAVTFDIKPKKAWCYETNKHSAKAKRWADVHVFCLHAQQDEKVNPLNLAQWEFYVLPTAALPPSQKTIRISSLVKLGAVKVNYGELKRAIKKAHQKN